MGSLLTRAWRYLVAALTGRFEEAADPKVQIEQAIQEAQDQHRQLTQRAASVIANQKKAEMDLDRAMQELEKVNGSTRQAVLMAEEAQQRGDQQRATQLTNTAEAFANQLIAKEEQVDTLKQLVLQSTQASDQAKNAVEQNRVRLEQRLAERQRLLSQLDQAKMQEQMNTAMSSLSETVGQDVPTLNEVRDKIEARYSKAKGMAELTETSVESRMLEVEQASMNSEAQARLAQIRSQLGLAPAADEPGQVAGAAEAPADAPSDAPGGTSAPGA